MTNPAHFGFWILGFGVQLRRANPKSRIERPESARRAFTLIEVLIAIGLALVLGATMFAFLHDMLATRARTLEHATRQRAAATLIERLEADLAACIVGDSRNGSGVQGSEASLRLLTRGVMPQLASRGSDDPSSLADLHDIEFRFNRATRSIDARKGRAGESSEFTSLGDGIAHVRFRYLDDRQWRSTFDSVELNRLPSAIEVCVWFNPWLGGPGDASDSAAAFDESNANVNFDENAFADASEAAAFRPPPPDRRRVIVIPDGGAEAERTPGEESAG